MGIGTPSPVLDEPEQNFPEVSRYIVALLGSQGVGKTALISQFMTSECINAYDRQKGTYSFFCWTRSGIDLVAICCEMGSLA